MRGRRWRIRIDGKPAPEGGYDFPGGRRLGCAGVAFIKACVESSASERKWVKFPAVQAESE